MRLVVAVFLRLLGAVSLVAFVSYAVQVRGLIGEQGLLPAANYMERVEGYVESTPDASALDFPTLCWWFCSDGALATMAWGGAAFAFALTVGLAPAPILLLLWVLYLSLTVAGQTFLGFQWDSLLLETLLVSFLVAPWTLHLRGARLPEPSRLGVFALRALLFKLMFLSGVVKLLSLDPAWWQLSALDVHYQTQPLPTWTSWWAHQLPSWFQRLSVLVMFVIEIAVPFAIFGPRRLRLLALPPLAALQLLIAATGNYGFFNLLTLALCVPLLDDDALRGWAEWFAARARRGLPTSKPQAPSRPSSTPGPVDLPSKTADPWLRARAAGGTLRTAALAFVLLTSSLTFARELVRSYPPFRSDTGGATASLLRGLDATVLRWGTPMLARTDPFRSTNGYGLFRAMTLERPEIVVEVSVDAESWTEVPFRWKPGDPSKKPRFAGPHMPRLDWQMWFAALDPDRARHWLLPLARELLSGEGPALGLLHPDTRPAQRPRYVRFQLYDYRFSTKQERRNGGSWWQRELLGTLRPGILHRGSVAPLQAPPGS